MLEPGWGISLQIDPLGEHGSERISYPNLSLSSSFRVMYICSWIRTSFTNVCKISKTSTSSPAVVLNNTGKYILHETSEK